LTFPDENETIPASPIFSDRMAVKCAGALAAVTVLAAVTAHAMPAEKPAVDYWWMFKNSDCGFDDVPGSCE
jgi:hypothetical protein